MQKKTDKKTPFLIKVALLFVLLGLGYYKNHHAPPEKIFSQKPLDPAENALLLRENPSSAGHYQIVKVEFKK